MSRERSGACVPVIIGLCAALGLLALPARAAVNTDDLVTMCEGRTGNPDVGIAMCNMYIAGIADMHFYGEYETGQRFFCFKEDAVTDGDIRKLFLAWVRQHPDMIHQSARYSMIQAMTEAYPCRD